MAVYFTNNQYLKTAEEDFEAAEVLYGHKYYDQIGTLCSVAMTKYLKAVLEAIYPAEESSAFYMTEDKIAILNKIKEKLPDFSITQQDCQWMDSVYGKANCTDGIHIIMPKQTIVQAFHLLAAVRKEARRCDKENTREGRFFSNRVSELPQIQNEIKRMRISHPLFRMPGRKTDKLGRIQCTEVIFMLCTTWLMLSTLLCSLQLSTGSFPKPLTEEEERRLLLRSREGDLEARNVLIERNLRLVAHIMKKYYAQTSDQEDLISIGTIGLIKGISTFDPDKGVRLATYAARCVENAILTPASLNRSSLYPKVSSARIGGF